MGSRRDLTPVWDGQGGLPARGVKSKLHLDGPVRPRQLKEGMEVENSKLREEQGEIRV